MVPTVNEDDGLSSLKIVISSLEEENHQLKTELSQLEESDFEPSKSYHI